MTQAVKPYEVIYSYTDAPTLRDFALSNTRTRCVIGPFGCLRGDMKVVTSKGLVRISDLTQPTHVLSWNEKSGEFQFSQASIAYPKGTDYLYQVVTPQGEFVAAGHHRAFCADHKYRQVKNLQGGDVLFLCSDDHYEKVSLEDRKSSHEGGLRWFGKFSDSLVNCVKSIRPCGLQPQSVTSNGLTSSQEQVDAQTLSSPFGKSSALHKDDRQVQSPERIHLYLCGDQKQIDGSFRRAVLHNVVSLNQTLLQLVSRIVRKVPTFPLFHPMPFFRCIKILFVQCFYSYKPPSITEWPIISIKRLKVKEKYWDLHVYGTNNYVTEDGTIHHNSGKSSACVIEIIRRAHEQAPGPDGIRRSRWVVVRNTARQLLDTTIKTFHYWFPDKIFGEWRVTDQTFIITRFPGVHLEVLFRALDRPDQVSNLLSLEVTGAWFNEVREIDKVIIEAMDARIGRYPGDRDGGASWYGTIMDTNPPDEGSYLYKMLEIEKPDGWQLFRQPSGLSSQAENTSHLPKDYYKNLAKGKDEMYVRVYVHGQYGFLLSGKAVFQSFSDATHVSRVVLEPTKGLDLIIGFDFALQPTCVIAQITALGQLRILDELLSDGMGLKQFCANRLLPLLRTKYFGYHVMGFGDPSGSSRAPTDESTCFEVLHSVEVGLNDIEPAPTNALLPRISSVEQFLNKMYAGEPGFLLSPNCSNLRKAMNGAYHYAKESRSKGEEYKMVPVKNYASHVSDALQMLCLYLEEKDASKKRWEHFNATSKRRTYRPADKIAGY